MYTENICLKDYPEWYRLERETEKIINKLSRGEELKFYLKNPDEYIRRLAILRINSLKLKGAVNALEGILDDPSESLSNKELAAWTIKSICLKWQMELFISHRMIYKFTGSEQYYDLFRISFEDSFSSPRFNLSSSPLTSKLERENGNHHRNQDIRFETCFSFQEWLNACYSEFLSTGKQKLIKLPSTILTMAKSLSEKFFTTWYSKVKLFFTCKLPLMLTNLLSNLKTNEKNKRKTFLKYERYPKDSERKKSAPLVVCVRGAVDRIFYLFCFPLRLIMKHKMGTLAALCACYCLLTFTDTGKIISQKYFGVSFYDLQNQYLNEKFMETCDEITTIVKKVLMIAWLQLKDIGDWLYDQWLEEIRK
ncbi:hypothetical protein [Candidatus Formimonas warabiya]|uniref:Uncharacterized protein n=1 Tax=Formimonas warabiya TaxID=1761012 RepID=A0A3G1KU86_FORW1|nr:hypothetical protein [Candidatus Formimonas warabiya]ATW26019.1 hypothetical protein DCMF_15670 [Candidatus Formimonas warabiya]